MSGVGLDTLMRDLAKHCRLLAARIDELRDQHTQVALRAAGMRDEAHCAQLLAKAAREIADHLTRQSIERR